MIKQRNNIAIMMLAHKNENQVNRLIKHLSMDFDVYVHIDKRSSINIEKYENVFIHKKYKLYWGSFNIIIATIYLLEKAYLRGYDRYILISGQDLPIKTNNEIKKFFENNYYEYISFIEMTPEKRQILIKRLNRFYPNAIGKENGVVFKIFGKILKMLFHIISIIKPRKIDFDFCKGSQWINITHNCVNRIFKYLENNLKFLEKFKWTSCADEIFFHTIIKKNDGLKIENNDLRYINWDTKLASPNILQKKDYELIISSNSLFARKFDENIDKEIIDNVYERITYKRDCK